VASSVPIRVFEGVRQISPGQGHTCLLLTSGTTQCWGIKHVPDTNLNTWTDSATLDPDRCRSFIESVPANTTQLADGASTSCALTADGTVHCANLWLTLRRGQRADASSALIPVRGITNAVQIAMGSGHACATLADQTVQC
jgi:alpha-tubulin suppressor-like RCC1 family protein